MSKRTIWILAIAVAYLVFRRTGAPSRLTPVGVDVGPVTGIAYA